MDSLVIAQFLESIYSEPPVPLTSELGRQIQVKSRSILGKTLSDSIMPREIYILSPRAQEYFRRTREASIGRSLEDVLDPTKEEQDWLAIDPELRAIGELMRTNKDEGPFILGAKPTYADFFIAGTLQCARMVDEGVFQRFMKYPGYKGIYEGCRPYMERND
ncbi:hypothetical protein EYB26_008809 [Talaromyces marneffei]|nr:uncharacterized protein EYB26_008809 [Talaromyces marneffei]QGA21099.1 hypothetical protein EYB26_008809 [Talaromyces marneffei]